MDALRRARYAEYLVLFVLTFIFGIAFQHLPIRAMGRISRRLALLDAIKVDTLALTAFQIGLFAWMDGYRLPMASASLRSLIF